MDKLVIFTSIIMLILSPYYVWYVFIGIKKEIIEKLRNAYIYNDPDFPNYRKVISGDWTSLGHSKFITRLPILFQLTRRSTLVMIMALIIIISFSMTALLGTVPILDEADVTYNIRVTIISASICVFIFISAIIIHMIKLEKYREEAISEKLIKEAHEHLN